MLGRRSTSKNYNNDHYEEKKHDLYFICHMLRCPDFARAKHNDDIRIRGRQIS